MIFNHKYLAAFGILLVASLACNAPTAIPQQSVSEVQTAAAQTLQSVLTPAITTTMEQPSAGVNGTSTPTSAPTETMGPTGTITPTYSVPMLFLREQTNCRAGPGQDYEILFAYIKGVRVEIIGHYPQEDYWLVKSRESPTGECWLWGEYADITGSYWVVASVTPPPTPTMSLPQAPAVKWEFNCNYAVNQMDVAFTWKDYAANETGYRLIRNDQIVVELPANSTAYNDTFGFIAGEKVVYQIEVYNATGFSRSAVISITC